MEHRRVFVTQIIYWNLSYYSWG